MMEPLASKASSHRSGKCTAILLQQFRFLSLIDSPMKIGEKSAQIPSPKEHDQVAEVRNCFERMRVSLKERKKPELAMLAEKQE